MEVEETKQMQTTPHKVKREGQAFRSSMPSELLCMSAIPTIQQGKITEKGDSVDQIFDQTLSFVVNKQVDKDTQQIMAQDEQQRQQQRKSKGEKVAELYFGRPNSLKQQKSMRLASSSNMNIINSQSQYEQDEDEHLPLFSNEDKAAYQQSNGRKFFLNQNEADSIEQAAEQMNEKVTKLYCVSGLAKDYNLDKKEPKKNLNHELNFVPAQDPQPEQQKQMRLEQEYPKSSSNTNYLNFLQDQIFDQRLQIKDGYEQQGYLGRLLLYLIDKLIQACMTSFHLVETDEPASQEFKPQIKKTSQVFILHDCDKIDKLNRLKMLKNVLMDCKRIKEELKKCLQIFQGELNKQKRFDNGDLAQRMLKLILASHQQVQTIQEIRGGKQTLEDLIQLDFKEKHKKLNKKFEDNSKEVMENQLDKVKEINKSYQHLIEQKKMNEQMQRRRANAGTCARNAAARRARLIGEQKAFFGPNEKHQQVCALIKKCFINID